MTTREMYDSTSVADIPAAATMVAAYVDGRYANVGDARARFPHARVVSITVLGTPGANVCDCESGDLTPAHAAAWAKRELAAGRKPTIYCLASQWGTVKAEVAAAGVPARAVSYWLADYDGDPTVPAGAVAKQYADPDVHKRGHFDLSAVVAFWPGVDPKPKPKPRPKPAPKPAPPRPLIRRGMGHPGHPNENVRHAQVRLTVHGARHLIADGIFGPGTEAAVVAFQKRAFPNARRQWDGIVGPHTWKALDS